MKSKDTINWVNSLKFWGILAVILGHITSPLSSFIYTWHMPFFFMISGFFINIDTNIKEYLKKQLPRLFIPYFSFALIALIVESIKRQALNRPALDFHDSLIGVFVWMDFDALSSSYALVLWFLPTLFFARFLVYLLMKSKLQEWIIFFILVLLFVLSFYIQLPFALDEAMNAAIFVFLGYWIYRLEYNVFLIALIWLGLYYYFGSSPLDMASKNYENISLNLVFAISFCMLLIAIVKRVSYHNAWLTLWGSNTMLLFILHPYTNNIATLIVDKHINGFWCIKLLISLILLQCVILFKSRYRNWRLFRYV